MEIWLLGIWCSTTVTDKPSSKRMGPWGKPMFGAIQASSSLLVNWPFDDLLSAETAFAMLSLRESLWSKVQRVLFTIISFCATLNEPNCSKQTSAIGHYFGYKKHPLKRL